MSMAHKATSLPSSLLIELPSILSLALHIQSQSPSVASSQRRQI